MENRSNPASDGQKTVLILGVIILLGFIAFGGYRYYLLDQTLTQSRAEFASSTTAFEAGITELSVKLSNTEKDNADLAIALQAEKDKMSDFEKQIGNISETVGTLDKLSKTDKELLQKYSKVYFLNEHYVPPKLAKIDSDKVSSPDKSLQVHSEVLPYLDDLIEEAADDNVDLKVASAYRSFGTQGSLKSGYTVTYGAGTANQFSADQGYSEHQLGTTVDFTTTGLGGGLTGFENTPAYTWLINNAYQHGFVLSYPQGNLYYQYEPWHWRFVGTKLARVLHRSDKNFYDLDQREIDKYLVNIFD